KIEKEGLWLRKSYIFILIILFSAFIVTSCSNNSESNENEDKETVRIGATPWTSTTFPSEVAKSVLEDMRYDVEIVEAELGALFASLLEDECVMYVDYCAHQFRF